MGADDRIRDVFLRHQARLDGVAASTAAQIAEEVRRALNEVEDRIRKSGEGTFTRARLISLRGHLASVQEDLEFRLSNMARSLAEGVTASAPGAVAEAAEALRASTLVVQLGRPSEDVLTEIFSKPFSGRSWSSWGRKLGADTTARVQQELAQAELLGEGIPAISARLRTVADLARSSADALARTLVSDIGNRSRVALAEQVFGRDVIRGYRFVAVLDGRTSFICAGLDGQTWREGDEAIQFPPLHPNCRSVLIPTTESDRAPEGERPAVEDTRTPREREKDFRADARERFGPSRWKRISPAQRRELIKVERSRWRRSRVGSTSAATSFEEWFASQSAAFQKDFLGSTRYRAYQRGLSIDAMATNSRPLTIADLAERYPSKFTGLTP